MADAADSEKARDAPSAHSNASSPVDAEPRQYEQIRPAKDDGASQDAKEAVEGHVDGRPDLSRHKSSGATSIATTTPSTTPPVQKPWYKQPNPLRWGKIPAIPDERRPSPEHNASFPSVLIFAWMGSLMRTGYKRQLELNDLPKINPSRAVDPTTDKMKESFDRRVKAGDKYPLFWAMHETYFRDFWIGGFCHLASTIFQVLSPFLLRFLIQFATDAYIANQRGLPPPHIGSGLGLVFGITAMQMLQSLGTNHFIYKGMIVGGMARASLISMIYEKSMVISGRAKAGGAELPDTPAARAAEKIAKNAKKRGPPGGMKGPPGGGGGGGGMGGMGGGPPGGPGGVSGDGVGWGNGRVTNLMSVDTYRIDQASGLFHIIWTAPLSILITLALLLVNLTYSALAGFALLVIGIPVLTQAIKKLFIRRKAINKITDQRVSLTQEILQSVRFVKFFGWEPAFLDRIGQFRDREIKAIQILLSIRNAIMSVSLALPIFASMLAFITYSLTHPSLPPAQVFSSLALFNSLRMPLNLLPLVIGQVTDAWSSMARIQEFMLSEEREDEAIIKPDAPSAVEMRSASFTWERTPTQDMEGTVGGGGPKKEGNGPPGKPPGKGPKGPKGPKGGPPKGRAPSPTPPGSSGGDASTLVEEPEPFKLQDLNFEIGRNELVAVIGTVGSGKTSLLAALAGDMRKTNGEVILGASRAFCPQYAWIQNTSVRENILFGKEMNSKWYNEVIKACALQPDLDMLPNHDLTEIGERGITISGGQKQRLNIARAIYFDADIVLMDDPLSAVDAHVGRHIFDNAILGLLKDKCRILATHQLWVLSRCDRIIWMEGGKIQAVDTFDNLMKNSEGFQQLMETTAVEEKKELIPTDGAEEEEGPAKKHKKAKGLMQTEERALASVPWSVYASYIKASGSYLNLPIVAFLLIIAQGSNIVTSLWLSYWTSDKFGLSMGVYIGVYAGLGVVQAMLMFSFMVALSIFGTTASKMMLRAAMARVLRAPMSFFDTTPLGRITNRFSRDVDVMDNTLTDAMRMYFFSVSSIISVFILIISFFYYFAIALVPLFLIFLFATSYYRASAREIKRFEAILRSSVFAKFSEGLSGVASIRAYGLKDRFIADLRKSIDDMDSAYYLTYSNQRWLSIRLDMVGNCLVFTTGILVVTSRFSVSPAIGGLVLAYILATVQMIQFTVRQLAEVENGMNAVERLLYYGTKLEEEAPLKTIEVRETWPEKGEIVFDNVEMRYRAGLPLVLQGLNMHIAGGERIGIVGRTGAGKSSIMSTLFRLVELSGGHITIDGVDISTVGLHDLRSRLAIIPQDPTLFRGTVRSNLDPFGEHTDLELWSALRQADLVAPENETAPGSPTAPSPTNGSGTALVPANRIHLDSVVEEDGLNFSLGQRQLMALARALVRGSQIIVCDEATSSVDMETDDKIQATMAKGFRGKTLLCIAHRLRTIIGYDRICVMDKGQIAEMGPPLELWKSEDGIFRGMCDRSGIRFEDIKGAREEMDGFGEEAEGSGAAEKREEGQDEKREE
ncbi:P-loop containing nucleoside triphosphate hydrolase protein [Echria macrotheca]|uniref:P-loop containing nucleoside triphosphate hydrolase protein n=1 Tax=Echria macrotheca TaxID=438768 RepID=A0AAJ0BRU4_9PEZI|nr:P-loop containing nucleoside triphosphate hydrolase protein [Echria macrotheca]